MYQVEQDPEIVRGIGVWLLAIVAFIGIWQGSCFLFGNTDKHRTPLQNFVRRALALFHWLRAVAVGVSYAIDAGVHGYYQAMAKPIADPRSERVRIPEDLPRKAERAARSVQGSV